MVKTDREVECAFALEGVVTMKLQKIALTSWIRVTLLFWKVVAYNCHESQL